MAFVAVLAIVAVSAVIYTFASGSQIAAENNRKTALTLVQVKDALIGYAASSPTQPGILPCPDNDNDGSADAPCGAIGVTAIGRVPWKTLGLPDLRDGSGECIWYVVSANFKNSGLSGPASVNSDSPGTLAVYDSTGTLTHPAASVAAVVIAAGTTLAGQNRSPLGTTVCGGNNNPADYLDAITVGATAFNNATGGGTNSFIAAPFSDPNPPIPLNDKLLPVTTDALFSVVEKRVLADLRTALRTYRSNNGYFPSANPYGDATFSCNYIIAQGRVPLNIGLGCLAFANWGSELPAWFATNNWQNVTYYAVSPCRVGAVGGIPGTLIAILCGSLGDITVDGNPNVHAVVFTAGSRIAALGQNRPCASVPDCLDEAANTDGSDSFVTPARSPTVNDRLRIVWP